MAFDLSDDDVVRLLRAIEHYQAYLHSQQRDDHGYQDLVERLKAIRKPAASETRPASAAARKSKSR